jgi:hypothetical protein
LKFPKLQKKCPNGEFSNQIPVDIPAPPNPDNTDNVVDTTPPDTEDDDTPPTLPGNLVVLPMQAISASEAQEPHVAANVFDGDLTTRWSAEGDGQWLQFDLGPNPVTIGQVAIAWHKGDSRSAAFTIDVSLDGTDWTEVYSGNSSGTSRDLEAYSFAAVATRYVRIVGFGNSANLWNSLLEVEID